MKWIAKKAAQGLKSLTRSNTIVLVCCLAFAGLFGVGLVQDNPVFLVLGCIAIAVAFLKS